MKQEVLTVTRRKLFAFPDGASPSTIGDGVSDALVLITLKLEQIDTKLGFVMAFNGIQASLTPTKADLLREFETSTRKREEKFIALQKENAELKRRVSILESQLSGFTEDSDIAVRRSSCIGFLVSDDLDRISVLSKWMNITFLGLTFPVGHICKAPVRSRSLTPISYIEFTEAGVRNAVLKLIRSKRCSCVYKDKEIALKPGLS